MKTPSPPLSRRFVQVALLAAACASTQGCGPSDPLEMKVAADSAVSFDMWESQARDRLGPERMADLGEALQQLRFRTMADGGVTGAEVEEGIFSVIDGRTVRYVLELGLGWELSQLKLERSQLDFAMRQNVWMRVRPGDDDSAQYVYQLRQRHEARLRKVSDEIDLLERKLVALKLHSASVDGAKPPFSKPADQPATPGPMQSPPQQLGCGSSPTKTPAET